MIFIFGFTRGGTTWLRDLVGEHPEIDVMQGEPQFWHHNPKADRTDIARLVHLECVKQDIGSRFVERGQTDSLHMARAVEQFPEWRFIFPIRDPRDVWVSHQRSTIENFRSGANATVEGCMRKIWLYWEGFFEVRAMPNILLTRYEDLQLNGERTLAEVWDFADVDFCEADLVCAFQAHEFPHPGEEHRDEHQRKGIIRDWKSYLEPDDERFFLESDEWCAFMGEFGYGW